jgi:hypothetical protein
VELFHAKSNRKFSFEIIQDFPKKFGFFRSSVPRYYLKPLDDVAESIPLKFVSSIISHINCFVNKFNDKKFWNLDFNIEKSDSWIPIMNTSQEKWLSSTPKNANIIHSPSEEQKSQVQFINLNFNFMENYEKLLTCFLANKIENQRAKYAYKKREERKLMTKKLFEMEVGEKPEFFNRNEDKENINVNSHQTIEETKHYENNKKMKKSLLLDKKKKSIPNGRTSFGFGSISEGQEKIFQERKKQLTKEIEDLFELEGKTLWNYSMSLKIQEGLLVELEKLTKNIKHEYGTYSSEHDKYLETIGELKQSIEVIE